LFSVFCLRVCGGFTPGKKGLTQIGTDDTDLRTSAGMDIFGWASDPNSLMSDEAYARG
jgi:hypothetical protein